MGKTKDMTGLKFGHLTAIRIAEKSQDIKDRHTYWICRCDCGKEISVMGKHLRTGKIISCGCSKMPRIKTLNYRHGLSESRIFNIWSCMIARCYKPYSKAYKDYGGRGIKVCDKWLADFTNFYNWAMANGYNDNLTIDRIDVNGNYCPENCRWTDYITQANNKRKTLKIEYQNEIHSLKEWSRLLKIKYETLRARILKSGWSVEKAFNTPVNKEEV